MAGSLFKPRIRSDGVLAICPDTGGIAVAAVAREPDRAPILTHCEYLRAARSAEQKALLGQLARRREYERLPCVTAIAGNEYSLLLVEAPAVPNAELRAAMRWRVKDLIDFHIDDAVIDVFEVPADKGGRRHMLYAVVARAAAVKTRVDQLLDAGFHLSAVDIPELTLRNVTALLPEDAAGVAFLHFAEDHGLIVLTRQGTLYMSRRFEPGAAALFGDAPALTPKLEGKLDAVVIEVQRSLDYYESHFGQPPVAGLVIGPGKGIAVGALEYLSSQLGVRARMLDLNELLDAATALDVDTQSHCLAAVGAALRREELAA
jgi:MSHA biogenesis protein MshI